LFDFSIFRFTIALGYLVIVKIQLINCSNLSMQSQIEKSKNRVSWFVVRVSLNQSMPQSLNAIADTKTAYRPRRPKCHLPAPKDFTKSED